MSPSEAEDRGRLAVYGPHYSAELVLYDGHLRQVARGVGELDLQVPPGIYQVEARLAEAIERQFAVVEARGETWVDRHSWTVQYASAAPLEGTWTVRADHQAAAREVSQRVTWHSPEQPPPEGFQSRLFVFVRTVEPGMPADFAGGLSLWAGDGTWLTDFTQGVEQNLAAGWLGCTADLPPGPYWLRFKRRGVRQRTQPIWLSPGWETHVFIPAREVPYLADLSIGMARFRAGFYADSHEAVAADVVLDGLQRGKNLADSEQMRSMLRGKFDNPWLGILAAHATRLDPDPQRWVPQIVLHNIRGMIGDHPDVRALLLKPDQPAEQPFDHPPMLRASLKLVRDHADLHPGTIPPDSLTARIYDGLLLDSPWTAWGNLEAAGPARTRPLLLASELEQLARALEGYARGEKSLDEIVLPRAALEGFFRRAGWPMAEIGPLLQRFGGEPGLFAEGLRDLQREQFVEWLGEQDLLEVSRQMGLPRVRVEQAVEDLTERPELLEGQARLSPAEQAVADFLRQRFEFELKLLDDDGR